MKTKLSKTKLSLLVATLFLIILCIIPILFIGNFIKAYENNDNEYTLEQNTNNSISAVYIMLDSGAVVAGSGTYVIWDSQPALLTAYHMFGENAAILSRFRACSLSEMGQSRECVELEQNILFSSFDDDIIVVALGENFRTIEPQIPVRNYQFTVGEELFAISSPNGLAVHMVLKGRVASLTPLFGTNMIVLDLPAWFGSSGSGIYNSEGRLVAILSGMLQSTTQGHEGIPMGNFSLVNTIP